MHLSAGLYFPRKVTQEIAFQICAFAGGGQGTFDVVRGDTPEDVVHVVQQHVHASGRDAHRPPQGTGETGDEPRPNLVGGRGQSGHPCSVSSQNCAGKLRKLRGFSPRRAAPHPGRRLCSRRRSPPPPTQQYRTAPPGSRLISSPMLLLRSTSSGRWLCSMRNSPRDTH